MLSSTKQFLLPVFIFFLLCHRALAGSNDDLIAYYQLNGSGADASGNENSGTVYNVVTTADRFGLTGQATAFNGTNSYIEVPDSIPLRLSATDFTIAAWVFETARDTNYAAAILTKRAKGSEDGWFFGIRGERVADQNGRLEYQVSGGADPSMISTGIIPLNQWHHVAIVYTMATESVAMYIDGELDSISNSLPAPNPDIITNMDIGCDSDAAYNNSYHFNGNIDDLRIYDRALLPADIFALYAPSPFFANAQLIATNFTTTVEGTWDGLTTVLQSSTNLLNWSSIQTNLASGPTESITNQVDPTVKAQFFRVYTP